MKIVAISGWKRSGKDTAGELLIKEHGFTRISFAGPLKDKVAADFSMTREEQDNQSLKEQPLLNMPVIPKDAFALNIVKFMFKELRDAKGRIPMDIHVDRSGAVLGIMDYPGLFSSTEEYAQLYWTRRALQILEGSTKRTVDSNYWVNQAINKIDDLNNSWVNTNEDFGNNKFVITDLRYKSEVEPLRAAYGKDLVVVRVNRFDSTESTDPSENDLNDYKFDIILENKGTLEDFLNKVREIANKT